MKKENDRNNLPPDQKIAIVQGQSLVDKTRERMKKQARDIDMTCKAQLRSDCSAVERCIKKLFRGKEIEKSAKELDLAVIRLQTSANNILNK